MRKVCEVYLVSSSATDERGVELTFPVSQYEMMDAFEQIHTKSPGDVYWQVDEFYCFDYLAPHLDESMSIFEFNSLTEQLSKLDSYQETALEGLLQMQVNKHMQENGGPITAQELMMLASQCGSLPGACRCSYGRRSRKILCRKRLSGGSGCPAGQRLCPLWITPKSANRCAKVKPVRSPRTATLSAAEELQPLPDYEPQREISYMIRLTLMNHENEQKAAVLDLPATEQRLIGGAERTGRAGMVRRAVHRPVMPSCRG